MVTRAPLQVLYPAVSSSSRAKAVPHSPSHDRLPPPWGISLQLAETPYPQPFWLWGCFGPLFCHNAGSISTPSTVPEVLCGARNCGDMLSGLSDASTAAGETGLAWKQKLSWSALQICAWHYIFSIQMPGESQVTFINLGFTSASWLNT